MKQKLKHYWKRFWRVARLFIILAFIAVFFEKSHDDFNESSSRILAASRDHTFNYVEWELNALFSKLRQELWGFHGYLPADDQNRLVLDYFAQQRRLWQVDAEIETVSDNETLEALQSEQAALQSALTAQQPLVEHIIETQVSATLEAEGFATLGQVLPPVTMHFLDIPDLLVVSPRDEIRQEMTLVLNPNTLVERAALEAQIASDVPDFSVWITPIGGVGVYPSMVTETDRPVVAFEITVHEWTHHYLIFFPLGLQYFSHPDTRIINETTATLVGDEIGNKVIERFYGDAIQDDPLVYLQAIPDYRQLLAAIDTTDNTYNIQLSENTSASSRLTADYLVAVGNESAAQLVLDLKRPTLAQSTVRDSASWIHHTRVTSDYLLSLGMVDAAEIAMENGRQHTGLRVLNQAWFAFNAGYQANPVIQQNPDGSQAIATQGGGGDPIGAAIYEIRARSASLKAFMTTMRGVTTREALFAALEALRE